MDKRSQTYICPTCKSTKTIKAHEIQTTADFQQKIPTFVVCGVGGCRDTAGKQLIMYVHPEDRHLVERDLRHTELISDVRVLRGHIRTIPF